MEKSKNRLDYLDCLRGIAILLVVFSHVWIFVFDFKDANFVMQLADISMLPLFFFISGFFSKIDFSWSSLWNRVRFLLVPTIIMYILYELARGFGYQQMLNDLNTEYKAGYWFPFALFFMDFTHAIISNLLPKSLSKKGIWVLTTITVLAIGIIVLKNWDWNHNHARLCSRYSLRLVSQYLPLYVVGMVCAYCRDIFYRLIGNEWLRGASLVAICVLLSCSFGGFFKSELLALVSVFILFGLFFDHQSFFSQSTFCGRNLAYIGRQTLPIYLIHYFFLLGMKFGWVRDVSVIDQQWCLISLLAVIFTIVIVYLSLGLRSIIALSTPLYRLLLGK